MAPMHHHAHNNCAWIEDVVAHAQARRVSEFFTSGGGDVHDVSVFWEPDLSSITNPFAICSPTNIQAILCVPSPSREFVTPPSSPTGSPDAPTITQQLDDTDVPHESKSPPATIIQVVSANDSEEKRSHTSHARIEGAPSQQSRDELARVVSEYRSHYAEENHKTHWQVWKDDHKAIKKKKGTVVVQPDEQKEDENVIAGAGGEGGEAIRVQTSRTTGLLVSAHHIRKRKINNVDGDRDSNNANVSPNPVQTVVKRICRERTGTDWQTVLDIVKYGEEQWMSRKG